MARKSNGPWFWTEKNGWYVHNEGKRINLQVKGIDSEERATKAWHRVQADGVPTVPTITPTIASIAVSVPTIEVQRITVKKLADAFLANRKGTVKATTHYVYDCLLRQITRKFGDTVATELKPKDVTDWLGELTVSQSTRSDMVSVLAASFNFGEGEGKLIVSNPLKDLKKPAGESRGAKSVIAPATHRKVLKAASPALRTLLTVLHATGARPSEITGMTATDFYPDAGVILLKEHKTANKTDKPRCIVLTPSVVMLLKGLVKKHPSGPLFRNEAGRRWLKDGIVLAMRRISKRIGVKVVAYGYRHSYATDCLSAGIGDSQTAALLGHGSTAMLHKHYSHLTSQMDVLRKAARRIRG